MNMKTSEVRVLHDKGGAQAGVCYEGPLRGQRVVRHSGGAWFPAGLPSDAEGEALSLSVLDEIFGKPRRARR